MPIILTPENVLKTCNGSRERGMINQRNFVHKITVLNSGKKSKDEILRMLMEFVYPRDFTPFGYHVIDNDALFLINNCASALEHLCHNRLTVFDIKLNLVLGHTEMMHIQFDPRQSINQALKRRYNPESKCMDLTEFHKDENLHPDDYCALSQPRLMKLVLSLVRSYNVVSIVLCKNYLKQIKEDSVNVLYAKKHILKSLDLRNNDFPNIESLTSLRSLDLSEIFLDENPICQEFDERAYIKSIREALPTIEKLDGRRLAVKGFMEFRRNFLIERNLLQFVNGFIEHFFNLYDSECRFLLNNMYEVNSMFSMTCDEFLGQESIATAKLDPYKSHSRNIIKNNDFSKNTQHLYVNGLEIIKLFLNLPKTEHDPFSFTVDVPFDSEEVINIIVTGVFREKSETELDAKQLLSFQRSFFLCPVGQNNEFVIRNEHLHVSNVTNAAKRMSFHRERTSKFSLDIKKFLPEPKNEDQEKTLVHMFSKITMLIPKVSKILLEKAQWNFAMAIDIFKYDLTANKIPIDCFQISVDEAAPL